MRWAASRSSCINSVTTTTPPAYDMLDFTTRSRLLFSWQTTRRHKSPLLMAKTLIYHAPTRYRRVSLSRAKRALLPAANTTQDTRYGSTSTVALRRYFCYRAGNSCRLHVLLRPWQSLFCLAQPSENIVADTSGKHVFRFYPVSRNDDISAAFRENLQ